MQKENEPKEPIESETRVGKYGIKAYGKWFCFNSKAKYRAFLMQWISGTDGSERDRAVDAMVALWRNVNFKDTD